jgi:hypothetical protein
LLLPFIISHLLHFASSFYYLTIYDFYYYVHPTHILLKLPIHYTVHTTISLTLFLWFILSLYVTTTLKSLLSLLLHCMLLCSNSTTIYYLLIMYFQNKIFSHCLTYPMTTLAIYSLVFLLVVFSILFPSHSLLMFTHTHLFTSHQPFICLHIFLCPSYLSM